jgi:nitrate reductase NapE component
VFDGGGGALISGFVTLGLLMAIVAVIAGRHLPDERATRPRAIYISVAMLPVLVIGALAAAAFIEALAQLILGPESPGGGLADAIGGLAGDGDPSGLGGLGGLLSGMGEFGFDATDAVVRTLVTSGITAVVAFALYRMHDGWRGELTGDADFGGSAAARVLQAFAYTATLLFVVLFAVSAVKAGYGIFRIAAPGTSALLPLSETAERERGIADLVSGLALAGASWWLIQMHRKLAEAWRGEPSPTPAPPAPPAE